MNETTLNGFSVCYFEVLTDENAGNALMIGKLR